MKRNHSEVKPCWPLFREKCEACGRMFRWERGVKWNRQAELCKRTYPILDSVDETICYMCKRCAPSALPSQNGMALRVDLIRKHIKESNPPVHFNCRCRTVNLSARKVGIAATEAAKNFARAGAMVRTLLEDIHIPRITIKEEAENFDPSTATATELLGDIYIPCRSKKENAK